MKKVAFHNLGCKVNSYETEVMMQQLLDRGYEMVPFEEGADVYVINTCTVTNIADRKSRQMLHRAKKMNPQAIVVAVGCYVQADPEKVKMDEAVDLLVGNDQKGLLADLIEARVNEGAENELLDLKDPREYEPLFLKGSEEHTRAFMKIQDGCNQFCSYCLIPFVRGRVRSRQRADVLEEAIDLAARGFREVVLTGIHLSSYGLDFPEGAATKSEEEFYGSSLRTLIGEIAEIPGIQRIRLGSLEPRIITLPFLRDLAACGKICPHFHLSLQSGCDTVLKRMNRHYTSAEYAEKCRMIREFFPDAAITTDVIVGFPGETEEEFEITRQFLEQIRFYEVHVFSYSRRKGTRADRMKDQVPENIKKQRSQILLALTEEHSREFRRSFLGREVEVLWEEEVDKQGEKQITGQTREYVRLTVPRDRISAEVGEISAVIVQEEWLESEIFD